MITSLAVGATFTIRDEATAVLVRMAEQLENLERLSVRARTAMQAIGEERFAGVSRSLASLERRMGTITAGAERMGVAFTGAVATMTTGLVTATEAMAAMAAEMRGIATATAATAAAARALAAAGAATAARAGAGGGGRGALQLRQHAGPFRGHAPVTMGEAGGIGLGIGLLEGVSQAAQAQRAYRFAIMADQVDPDSPQGQVLMRRLIETATETTHGTIFSRADVAKTMPGIAGMTGMSLEKTLPMMPGAIRYAEFEKQLGASVGQSWEPRESAASLIRLLHSMGITDPSQMEKMADLLVPATQTGDVSPQRLMNVLQYMTSPARGLGMSERETIQLGGVGSLLFPGTRAGTNIGMMLQKIEQVQAGPLPGMSKMALHHLDFLTKSMTAMGLVDPKTHRLFQDEHGSTVRPLLEHLRQYEYMHPGTAAGMFQQVFETRGGRAAFELGQGKVPGLYDNLSDREDRFPGVRKAQTESQENLISQVERSWSRTKDVLGDIADPLLPTLTAGFKGLAGSLESLDTYLIKHRDMAAAAGIAAGGAALTSIYGLVRRFLPGGSSLPATATIGSTAINAAAVPLAVGMFTPDSWLPGGERGATANERGEAMAWMFRWINRQFTGAAPGHEHIRQMVGFDEHGNYIPPGWRHMPISGAEPPGGGPVPPGWQHVRLPQDPGRGAALTPLGTEQAHNLEILGTLLPGAAAAKAPGGTVVYITNNISVQGVTMAEIVSKVVAALTGLMHGAVMRNSGAADGSKESAYTSGAEGATLP